MQQIQQKASKMQVVALKIIGYSQFIFQGKNMHQEGPPKPPQHKPAAQSKSWGTKGLDFLRGLDNSQTCFECQGEDAIRKLVDDFNAKLQAGDILVLFFFWHRFHSMVEKDSPRSLVVEGGVMQLQKPVCLCVCVFKKDPCVPWKCPLVLRKGPCVEMLWVLLRLSFDIGPLIPLLELCSSLQRVPVSSGQFLERSLYRDPVSPGTGIFWVPLKGLSPRLFGAAGATLRCSLGKGGTGRYIIAKALCEGQCTYGHVRVGKRKGALRILKFKRGATSAKFEILDQGAPSWL